MAAISLYGLSCSGKMYGNTLPSVESVRPWLIVMSGILSAVWRSIVA